MAYDVKWSRQAEQDVLKARDYLNDKTPGKGTDLARQVIEYIENVLPLRLAAGTPCGTERFPQMRWQRPIAGYKLYYTYDVKKQAIWIARVFHTRQLTNLD